MPQIYIIADLHFGHTKLAIRRGFGSVESHDEYIIQNWNNVITKRDTAYILGDITMERNLYAQYFPRLKGIKKVILGNHDKPQHVKALLNYVNSVAGMYKYKQGVMTHCPIHPMELQTGRFNFNLHGHIHHEVIDDDRYIGVSCEQVNYTPQLISKLIEKFI